MKGAWRIGRIAGIDVFVHFTFLILVAWVGIGHYLQKRSWTDAWNGGWGPASWRPGRRWGFRMRPRDLGAQDASARKTLTAAPSQPAGRVP